MVALTNEIQTMLFFPRIFKFNTVMYLNSIKKPNVLHLPKFYPSEIEFDSILFSLLINL